MNELKDGGPAFARPIGTVLGKFNAEQSGMSLLDYFAGMALQGLLACPHVRKALETLSDPAKAIGTEAYDYAQAMLKARASHLGQPVAASELPDQPKLPATAPGSPQEGL